MFNFIKQNAKAIVMHKATNYALTAFILAVALFYIYFASITVRTLTVLEKTKGEMQSLTVEVSEMESQHLSIENGMNQQKALQLGFVEVNNPTFIIRSPKATLSLKTD